METKDIIIILLGILVVGLLFNSFNLNSSGVGCFGNGNYGYGMMSGWSFGGMWIFMLFGAIALVVFIVWMITNMTTSSRKSK